MSVHYTPKTLFRIRRSIAQQRNYRSFKAIELITQGVSPLCAMNDREAFGSQYQSKRSNEHSSGYASVKMSQRTKVQEQICANVFRSALPPRSPDS